MNDFATDVSIFIYSESRYSEAVKIGTSIAYLGVMRLLIIIFSYSRPDGLFNSAYIALLCLAVRNQWRGSFFTHIPNNSHGDLHSNLNSN